MSAVSGPSEPTNEDVQLVDRAQLSHEEAATLLNDALAMVNEQLQHTERGFQVIYNGQPHLKTKAENAPQKIDPSFPIDLALLHNGNTLEPIDIIDLVDFVGYDSSMGRQTTGFMSTQRLAQAIEAKIEEHLESKKSNHILISPVSGTKYNVEKLIGHTLAIDPLNYLRLDGHMIAYYLDEEDTQPKALTASSLRSSGIMHVGPHEFNERLYLYESNDPAPRFYFDLSKIVSLAKERFPNDQQIALETENGFYMMRRDPEKI